MSEEMTPPETGELRAIERRLLQLTPAAHGMSRDGFLFEAGKAAQRARGSRGLRLWQGAFAMMAGISAALLAVAIHRGEMPTGMVRERVVYVHDATPGADSPPAMMAESTADESGGAASSYLAMRRHVLAAGVGALDAAGRARGAVVTGGSHLQ